MVGGKRQRTANYTNEESHKLLDIVQAHKDVTLSTKKLDGTSLKAKYDAWEKVCVAFNSEVVNTRTMDHLRRKYYNMKTLAKSELTNARQQWVNTGVRPHVSSIAVRIASFDKTLSGMLSDMPFSVRDALKVEPKKTPGFEENSCGARAIRTSGGENVTREDRGQRLAPSEAMESKALVAFVKRVKDNKSMTVGKKLNCLNWVCTRPNQLLDFETGKKKLAQKNPPASASCDPFAFLSPLSSGGESLSSISTEEMPLAVESDAPICIKAEPEDDVEPPPTLDVIPQEEGDTVPATNANSKETINQSDIICGDHNYSTVLNPCHTRHNSNETLLTSADPPCTLAADTNSDRQSEVQPELPPIQLASTSTSSSVSLAKLELTKLQLSLAQKEFDANQRRLDADELRKVEAYELWKRQQTDEEERKKTIYKIKMKILEAQLNLINNE